MGKQGVRSSNPKWRTRWKAILPPWRHHQALWTRRFNTTARTKNHPLRTRQQLPPKRRPQAASPNPPGQVSHRDSHPRHWQRRQLSTSGIAHPSGTSVPRKCRKSCGCPQRPTVPLWSRALGIHLWQSGLQTRGSRLHKQNPFTRSRTLRRPSVDCHSVCGATQW